MKIPYKWLKEYLDLDVSAAELGEKIERTAVEVDSVASPSAGMKKVVVGEIVAMEPHPDSDHLNICQVNIGEAEPTQIVCGAPNAQVGKKVIAALSGARIADNIKIKKSKMRGVQSNGMLCALQEIGFPESVVPKEYVDGIYFLPDDAVPGASVFPYLGMDDDLIDIDVTPNRGDMLSVYGTTYELAAIYDQTPRLNHPDVPENTDQKAADLITANVDKDLAAIYKLRVVQNIEIKPSPMWMQIKLWDAGIRPINNVVDATNYIMLKYGQPLHAFDLDKFHGKQVNVRLAQPNETLTTLDGNDHETNPNDIVIASEDAPIMFAGVMGGLNTEIDDTTKNVVIEAAVFDPIRVRKTAQRQNLHTDASQRFERGVNHGGVQEALDAAAQLMHDQANGQVAQGTVTGSDQDVQPVLVDITIDRINKVLGTELSVAEVTSIFTRLGFGVEEHAGLYSVSIPSRRWDITIDADLIEEVARIYGYDNLPTTLPTGQMTLGVLSPAQRQIRATRTSLEAAGLNQAISYSLTTEKKAAQFALQPTALTKLAWPMSSDHAFLRTSLISGLLDDVAYNEARKVKNVALYEQGRVFYREDDQIRPTEEEHVAGVLTGTLNDSTWNDHEAKVDFYQMKGIVEHLLRDLAVVGPVEFEATADYPDMHPGRTAAIFVHGHRVGFVGQVHPRVEKQWKISETYTFEMNLQMLIDMQKSDDQYNPISKYPAITRDIAMLVDANVTNQQVLEVIKKRGGAHLTQVKLFDVYTGSKLPADKKSLAYTLTYQDKTKTLVDEDVTKAFEKVEKFLESELDAEIR
ncbi:phenylalanine--tRNA ligase subunit beta [Levilactobacillus bambusae]|uniref:Phenylalanine--tRNA ligase beta subunit n=1 Tax=Levilactobacillus bambusae TaxID=2024736 RepID=A0A2V1N191_9LACO|nr:phenylalanine--tRNA ligase subunit beta [Levilactobacillus bambusae]PWG01007.1 phenylalanine--tRNA ligase subunit beta [Levilactobacillus bambusae]